DGLGGFWGWVEFDRFADGTITGDAQFTDCHHFIGPLAGWRSAHAYSSAERPHMSEPCPDRHRGDIGAYRRRCAPLRPAGRPRSAISFWVEGPAALLAVEVQRPALGVVRSRRGYFTVSHFAGLMTPRRPQGSGQVRIWVAGQEAAGSVVVDQQVIGEPLNSTALGADVAEGVPRRHQFWILLVELVLEMAEGSFALDGQCQPAPGAFISDCVGEVGHVLVPDPGRQRVDADQIQLVGVDRCLPVDTGVSRPERDLSGLWVYLASGVRSRFGRPARRRSPPGRGCSGQAWGQDRSLLPAAIAAQRHARPAAEVVFAWRCPRAGGGAGNPRVTRTGSRGWRSFPGACGRE